MRDTPIKQLPYMARRIRNTHLTDTHHALYAPYGHRAVFHCPPYLREPLSIRAYSHLPIVAWKWWEAYLLNQLTWTLLVQPEDWPANTLFNPFEHFWPPRHFYATENFAMQRYDFTSNLVTWNWTIAHQVQGHHTDQLRLHWQHENRIHALSNNRTLPLAEAFPR